MKTSIPSLAAIALVAIATSASAAEHHYTQKVVAVGTQIEQYSAHDLKRWGVPDVLVEEIEKRMPEDKTFGRVLPVEDYPKLSVSSEGTGDVRVSGTIPVTTPLVPLPVLVFVRRADCEACDYRFMTLIWATSTETGLNPPAVKWYRVEEVDDTLQWAYGGGFDIPGLYTIKLATLHPKLGIWMTQEYPGFDIAPSSFWIDRICQDGDDVRVSLAVTSLRKIRNGTVATADFGGTGVKSGTLSVDASTARQGIATFTLSLSTYGSLVGADIFATVTLPDRSSQRTVYFHADLYDCNNSNSPKGATSQ